MSALISVLLLPRLLRRLRSSIESCQCISVYSTDVQVPRYLSACTIDVPCTSTRNVTVTAITSIWTSMIPSIGVSYVAILTVVGTFKKSFHRCYTIIMIVSIPVDVDDFRLASFLEL